jgi:hypothetical protein
MANRYEVRISDGKGGWLNLRLARNQGAPVWKNSALDPLGPTFQTGEATYASFLPRVSGVYVQADLSDGAGQKIQVQSSDANAHRYYYAEWVDASVAGQIQKGPAISTITKPTNSGPLVASYELGGVLYLVLGRIVAAYSAGTLTTKKDYGAGEQAYSGTKFFQLAAAALESGSSHATDTVTIDSSADRVGQRIMPTQTAFLDRVVLKGGWTGASAPLGDIYLAVSPEYSGKPSGQELALVSKKTESLTTVATSLAANSDFRFEPLEPYLQVAGEPYWIVADVAGATTALTVKMVVGTGSTYLGGLYATSQDDGETWTTAASSADMFFELYTRAIAPRAFLGRDSSNTLDVANTTIFTSDATYKGKYLLAHGGTLFRDCQSSTNAAVSYTFDGTNWEEAVLAGDPTVTVTGLYSMQDCVLVCTENGIWAMELPDGTNTPAIDLVYSGGRSTSNGVGGCVWQGIALIPFDGRLVGISGGWSSGFTVHKSIGPESLDQWQSPWGTGRVVALAAGRYHVYAAMSTATSYKLFKSSDPLAKKWHGSIADLGTPTAFTHMVIWDQGGATNPLLFFSTTSDNIGYITLPRTANPAGDTAYQYDIANTGYLYFPLSHANFHISPKAWLAEALTFQTETAGGKVGMMYDTQDGSGWHYLGHLYRTGEIPYPQKMNSLMLGRRLVMENTSATGSPILVAAGLTYALRTGGEMRELRFAVEVDDNLSAMKLGDMLGVQANNASALLRGMAFAGGTRTLTDWRGETYNKVLFIQANETLLGLTETGGKTVIEIVGVTQP